MRHLNSFQLTRFVELLTATELFYDTRLIEFAFEFLNRALHTPPSVVLSGQLACSEQIADV